MGSIQDGFDCDEIAMDEVRKAIALEVAQPSGGPGEADELVWPEGSQDDADIIQDAAVALDLTATVRAVVEDIAEDEGEPGPSTKKAKTDGLASATDVAASLAFGRVFEVWSGRCVYRIVSYRGCRNRI